MTMSDYQIDHHELDEKLGSVREGTRLHGDEGRVYEIQGFDPRTGEWLVEELESGTILCYTHEELSSMFFDGSLVDPMSQRI